MKTKGIIALALCGLLFTACNKTEEEPEETTVITTRKAVTNSVILPEETTSATTTVTTEEPSLGVTSAVTTVSIDQPVITARTGEEEPDYIIDDDFTVVAEENFIDKAVASFLNNNGKSLLTDETRVTILDLTLDGVPELLLTDLTTSRKLDGLDLFKVRVYDFRDMSKITEYEDAWMSNLHIYKYPTETHYGIMQGQMNVAYLNGEWVDLGTYEFDAAANQIYYLPNNPNPVEWDVWEEAVRQYLNWDYVDESEQQIMGETEISPDMSDSKLSYILSDTLTRWSLQYGRPDVAYFD